MSLIRLENIAVSFAGKPVLTGADLRIEEGEKVGLIGRNGCGKSTLFRVVTGEVTPDGGLVDRMRRGRIACLAQLPDVDESTTIHDAALTQFEHFKGMEKELNEMEAAMADGNGDVMIRYSRLQDEFALKGGYEYESRVKAVLTGLGFSEEEFSLPFGALSGGQRTRLMLALVLLEDADLLLLDEPENHLDLAAREWLETFLQEWRRAFVIISHDRQMLNAVVERVVEVQDGRSRSYPGNYEAYLNAKALQQEQQEKVYKGQQEFIEKEERLINRFRYKATKARMVQSRIKRLEKMDRVDAPESARATVKLNLGEPVRSGQVVLEARRLSMAYDDLRLYDDVSFKIERGERVGIIGPNGCGKTTLLRQLARALPKGEGEVVLGHKVRPGLFSQHHETLNPQQDILTEVHEARTEWSPEQIRKFLGAFLFTGDDVFKPVSALSGGERARVALAKLILSEANVLLLDEPTNHLDIASREALEDALQQYPGAIVMVSHDRALIDRLVERLLIFEDGHVVQHLGNYSSYRWKVGGQPEKPKPADDAMKVRKNKTPRPDKIHERDERKLRKRFEELESSIEEMEQMVEELEGRFGELDPKNHEEGQQLKEEYEGLKADLGEMYAEWEALSEELAN